MKTWITPAREQWDTLCQRPYKNNEDASARVAEILAAVQQKGDQALAQFSLQFDGWESTEFRVSESEFEAACTAIPQDLKQAIDCAFENIQRFHAQQKGTIERVETMPGVTCWRKSVGIEKVGLYIPGGSAPLFSSLLMLGVPAVLAGCKEIVVCSPPCKEGRVAASILYTAKLLGITSVWKIGGAQAIAAMAYGTQSVPRVDKIFGPGNQFVTLAKEQVQAVGVAIDMPAGPSELLVIADETADPAFVAADLLSQAEHGPDSQVVVLSPSRDVVERVQQAVQQQLAVLPRRSIAEQALENSRFVVCVSLDECLELSNYYAPEHLILAIENAEQYAEKVIHAGSVFIGNFSCESAGDYASGTNHTLPTNGYARNYSGVSYDSFVRKITFQKLSAEGLRNLGTTITTMAEAEGLVGHSNAVKIRLNSLNG